MADILTLKGNVVNSSMLDKVWLFYGPPGTYKTTVATGDTEHTLLAAYEIGYKFIPNVKAVSLTNWHGLKDLIRQLDEPEARKIYKTLAIDTVGLAYKACVAYICAQKGVREIGEIPYGQGYSMAKNEFEKTIGMIPQMGYGLIMVAHSDELLDEKNGVSVKVDIDKRPSTVIKGMADFILYARKEKKDGAEGNEMSVYAYSETNNPNIEVKSRARFFPKRVEFTHKNILAALDYAVKEQDKFFGTHSDEKPNFDVFTEKDVNLDEIKKEIVMLATELSKTPLSGEVAISLQNHLKGVKVSEATKGELVGLYSVRDDLMELKKSL